MRRYIFAAVANWLRKPANREKAKHYARQTWNKYQNRNKGPNNDPNRR